MTSQYTYQIDPRPPELGGGWRLRLLQDGAEVGGGVFPPADDPNPGIALTRAHADALAEAEMWLAARAQDEDIPRCESTSRTGLRCTLPPRHGGSHRTPGQEWLTNPREEPVCSRCLRRQSRHGPDGRDQECPDGFVPREAELPVPAAAHTQRRYPLPRPTEDPRFTIGLALEVADLLARHGYPRPEGGQDIIELQQALFRFLYAHDAR